MPVKVRDLVWVARKLGFIQTRQKGSHARWIHPDGHATTIPIHSNAEIGDWLYHEILVQMNISEKEFLQILDKSK